MTLSEYFRLIIIAALWGIAWYPITLFLVKVWIWWYPSAFVGLEAIGSGTICAILAALIVTIGSGLSLKTKRVPRALVTLLIIIMTILLLPSFKM